MNKLFYILIIIGILTAFNVLLARTDSGGTTVSNELTNPLKIKEITDLLASIIDFLILIGAPIMGIMVIYGGFLILTAGDSPDKVKSGKNVILWAVVGYIIVLSSWGVLYIIKEVTGANIPGL